MDELAEFYKKKKNVIKFFNNDLPKNIDKEVLENDVETFSDLIYKDKNVYRVLKKLNKKKNTDFLLNKLRQQIKTTGLNNTALRIGLKVIKNQNIKMILNITKN